MIAMRHHAHGYGPVLVGTWLVPGAVLLLIVVLILIAFFYCRQPDGLSRAKRRELGPFQIQILSMLRQNGGGVPQSEISDIVPIDAAELAIALHELEGGRLVRRKWDSDKQVYMVWAE